MRLAVIPARGGSKRIPGKNIRPFGGIPVIAWSIRAAREGYISEYALVLKEKAEFRRSQQEGRRLLGAYGIELDDDSRSDGVVVSAVSPLGEAYRYGLKKGDRVRSVNGRTVASVEDFLAIFHRDSSRLARMEIIRDSRLYTVDFSAELE